VARITAPFAGTNPLHYALIGFGATGLIILLFFFAEKFWLQGALNLQSLSDPEIAKRMYPMF